MRTGTFLDADMGTVANWLRDGWHWWIAELAAMLPDAFRPGRGGTWIDWQGPGHWAVKGRGKPRVVLVHPGSCLLRQMQLPPMSQADLDALIALDADRIMPVPASRLVLAAAADRDDRARVTVAAMPLSSAQSLAADLAGVSIRRVAVADPEEPGAALVDLTAGFAAAGLIAAGSKAARGWWLVAAFAVLLNLGLLIWRDAQSVRRMEELVSAQQPAVSAARAIAARIRADERRAITLAARRKSRDPLAALDAVISALPAGVQVERYEWDGASIRLSGTRPQDTDVAGALRRSGRFAGVRSAPSDLTQETPQGRPFALIAMLPKTTL